MRSMIIVYTVFVVSFLLFQIFSVVRFAVRARRAHASFLLDLGYSFAMLLFHIVGFSLLFDAIYCVLISPDAFADNPLPFAVGTMPIIASLSSLMLNEGLFAYTDDRLYGRSHIWELSSIEDIAAKSSMPFHRARVTISFDNSKKALIRTSMSRYEKFSKAVKNSRIDPIQ